MQDNTLIMVNPNGQINTTPLYFPVAMPKFVIMFIITFGLYGLFWWYKTFKAMGKSTLRAIISATVIYLTIRSFVDDLKQHLDTAGVPNKLNPREVQFVYLGYFILSVASHIYLALTGNQASMTLLTIMVLLKLVLAAMVLYFTFNLVKLVNQVNIAIGNAHLINTKYTAKTFIGIGIAILLALSSFLI
jgi:hypothetical protein